jgi:hypothetical protein
MVDLRLGMTAGSILKRGTPQDGSNPVYWCFMTRNELDSAPAEHPETGEADDNPMLFCPVCSSRLESRKCKLLCPACGYYMSCADYY